MVIRIRHRKEWKLFLEVHLWVLLYEHQNFFIYRLYEKSRGKFTFCVLPMIIFDFLADNQGQLSAGTCPNNPNTAQMVT